jgi:hypothetical protein
MGLIKEAERIKAPVAAIQPEGDIQEHSKLRDLLEGHANRSRSDTRYASGKGEVLKDSFCFHTGNFGIDRLACCLLGVRWHEF